MNKQKFTPGPWRYSKALPNLIECREGRKQYLYTVCQLGEGSGWSKNKEANAALIAAAPEMYEALADIAENCGNHGCSETCAEADCKICEILKKARGEA